MSALRVFFLSNGHEPFVQNIGLERVHGRPIGMFGLAGWIWDSEVRASRPFTLFVVAESPVDDRTMEFATAAIAAGCRYVSCWGSHCERVHDTFDDASITDDTFVMSTWHSEDALHEALYFALALAVPDEVAPAESPVVIAVEQRWESEVRALLAEQDEQRRR
jgi:hypothetical protein